LDVYTHEQLFEPLGMHDTLFAPPASLKPRIAPTECVDWRGGLVHGLVHDENSWVMDGVAGHAGLFSTVEDLARFCQMLLGESPVQLFTPESLLEMRTVQMLDDDGSSGLGWVIGGSYYMGSLLDQAGAFGHTGFTGTSLVLHPERKLAIVLLTNRVCPTREGPNLSPIRQQVGEAAARLAGL
jgi:CubicO group peptidase (beta-lactamase class C family)